MMTDNNWHLLEWKDNAGREDSMAGPLESLQAQIDVLKKNKIDYNLEAMDVVVEAPKKRTTKKTAAKKVAGKELETR